MHLKTTRYRMFKILTKAVNESKPAGHGLGKYVDKTYSLEEVMDHYGDDKSISCDYFEGRRVKLYISEQGGVFNFLTIGNPAYFPEWMNKYGSLEELFLEAGVRVMAVDVSDD